MDARRRTFIAPAASIPLQFVQSRGQANHRQMTNEPTTDVVEADAHVGLVRETKRDTHRVARLAP